MRLIDADKLHVDKQINGKCWISQEQIINAPTEESALKALEDVRAEITGNLESIIGKYDSNTKPEDMPSRKIERNNGRTEAIDIINRKIAEVTKNE